MIFVKCEDTGKKSLKIKVILKLIGIWHQAKIQNHQP